MAESRFCGPGAARVLSRAGAGTVVAAFGGGGYLRLPGGYVLLAPDGSPRGPLSLLVDGLRAPRARAIVSVSPRRPAGRRGGDLGRQRSASGCPGSPGAERRVDVAARGRGRRGGARPGGRGGRGGARRGGARPAGAAAGSPRAGAGRRGRPASGPGRPRRGATPAGDDALAGRPRGTGRRERRRRSTPWRPERCSPIGLAYLECATRGELPPFFDGVVRAVAAGDSRRARGGPAGPPPGGPPRARRSSGAWPPPRPPPRSRRHARRSSRSREAA